MSSSDSFQLSRLSPIIGTSIKNFFSIIRGQKIDNGHRFKLVLSFLIILILTPFRWYEAVFWRLLPKSKKNLSEPPVFILGHWRSGTTHLHNLIAKDPTKSFLNTYQSVFPHYLGSKWLFQPLLKLLIPKKRPGDNVKLATEFPQEDGMAVLNSSEFAYYRFFYFPKNYQDYLSQFVLLENLSEAQLLTFSADYSNILSKASYNTGSGQLVVKNPMNTGRVNWLLNMYSSAVFIHIVRNPYIVFLSTRKFFRELMPTLWLEAVSQDFLTDMILENYCRIYDSYLVQSKSIPKTKLIEIRFESLEKEPLITLKTIYERVGIKGFEEAIPNFQEYINSQNSYMKNVHKISRTDLDLIESRWEKYLAHWGYSVPENIEIHDDILN